MLKALPGLKQSGRAWFRKLSKVMNGLGYTNGKMDPCVFKPQSSGRLPLCVAVHVDDGILVCDSVQQKDALYNGMQKHFGM